MGKCKRLSILKFIIDRDQAANKIIVLTISLLHLFFFG
ncbi:hypothetical protein N0824_00350 [Microcystis sp. 0824]|uniref:Uncharacterized protein n=1 Tax=Microcystis aeruginosa NIES-2549 TaxID=1641812 RepID=A0A0F6U685_MICAE|nr:hypothetical protein MYAER_2954 [Microcystis aeruginosa NIES-2549]AOC53701.1 hypothetical protein amyaer_2994 [Microcystis aeruginosa NIES-2481]GBF52504.1 hypothetical protein N0824_00350 [Microcystis sp. 0824]